MMSATTLDVMWRYRVVICIHGPRNGLARLKFGDKAYFGFPVGMEVCFMTLQTQERLILFQEVVCHGPVGLMTLKTAFCNRGMLKDKWSLVTGMTLKAQVV